MVHHVEGTPPAKQQLVFCGTVLDNTCTLVELEMRGGGQPIRLTLSRSEGPFALTGSMPCVFRGRADSTLRLWDLGRSSPILELRDHTTAVLCMAVDWDAERVLIGSLCLELWDVGGGALLQEMLGSQLHDQDQDQEHDSYKVLCVAMHWASQRAVSGGSDGIVWTWDLQQETAVHQLTGHGDQVLCMAVDWTST